MDSDLFKYLIEQQNIWRKQYYADKKTKRIIRTICNRKYQSKGNKDIENIHKSLVEMGFLEEVKLIHTHSGELCYDILYGK
jgi:hypothetical protein